MPRKKSRKKSVDAKILQKLNEIDREFKSMERFRLSMVKSRKTRIMKRIKKGEPADYKGYKKELTARVKTHLTRVNKSIKAYSKILKKKSRKPRKKTSGHKKSRKPRKKKSVKKSVKKSRKPRKKKSVKKSRKPRKKKSRKKMKMCGCGIGVHFRMKKNSKKTFASIMQQKTKGIPMHAREKRQFYAQIVQALKICGVDDEEIEHMGKKNLLSKVITGQMLYSPKGKNLAILRIFSQQWFQKAAAQEDEQAIAILTQLGNKTVFEFIEAARTTEDRIDRIISFYKPWLCIYAKYVQKQALMYGQKTDEELSMVMATLMRSIKK